MSADTFRVLRQRDKEETELDRTWRQHGRPWDRAHSVFSVSADDKPRVNTAGTTDTGTTDGNREDIHAGNLITVPIATERFDKIVTDRKYPYDKEDTSGLSRRQSLTVGYAGRDTSLCFTAFYKTSRQIIL